MVVHDFLTRSCAPWPCGRLSGFSCVECWFMHAVGIGHGRLTGLGCDAGPRCFRRGQPISAGTAKAGSFPLCWSSMANTSVRASVCIQFPPLQMEQLDRRDAASVPPEAMRCVQISEYPLGRHWPVVALAPTISRGAPIVHRGSLEPALACTTPGQRPDAGRQAWLPACNSELGLVFSREQAHRQAVSHADASSLSLVTMAWTLATRVHEAVSSAWAPSHHSFPTSALSLSSSLALFYTHSLCLLSSPAPSSSSRVLARLGRYAFLLRPDLPDTRFRRTFVACTLMAVTDLRPYSVPSTFILSDYQAHCTFASTPPTTSCRTGSSP
ncbi:hypothetical protein IG631_15258 [Alternaria alternata]|nr:hypothetical protein IG631_15258 [Alternaria alternata]